MGIKIRKYTFFALFIFIIIMIGGCNMDQNNEKQQIVDKAKEITIKYFKEKENLDVEITDHRFPSNELATVFISGHIKNDKSKKFTASVEYNDNYTIGSISTTNFSLKY